jgi:hypothetical protein
MCEYAKDIAIIIIIIIIMALQPLVGPLPLFRSLIRKTSIYTQSNTNTE